MDMCANIVPSTRTSRDEKGLQRGIFDSGDELGGGDIITGVILVEIESGRGER
jgi:hypothetical protein